MSIELSKQGQVYRFFRGWDIYPPSNLCELFWKITLIPALMVAIGTFIVFLVAGFVIGTVLLIGAMFLGWPLMPGDSMWAGMTVMAALVWLVVFGVLICWAASRGANQVKGTPPLEIAAEAYAGFKDKYCPTIRWNDDA